MVDTKRSCCKRRRARLWAKTTKSYKLFFMAGVFSWGTVQFISTYTIRPRRIVQTTILNYFTNKSVTLSETANVAGLNKPRETSGYCIMCFSYLLWVLYTSSAQFFPFSALIRYKEIMKTDVV